MNYILQENVGKVVSVEPRKVVDKWVSIAPCNSIDEAKKIIEGKSKGEFRIYDEEHFGYSDVIVKELV